MNDSAVSSRNVFFSYEGTPVLEDVTFEIRDKEFVYIIGPNGGGKTTLVKLILGLLKPQVGEIRVLGQTPERARKSIGYVAQHAHHDPQFPITVMDVVLMGRLGRKSFGRHSKADRLAALKSLDDVDLLGTERRLFSQLSGGQRQRVLIARALVNDPKLLLLDEPTANVDVVIQEKINSVLNELSNRMAIMMVSHDVGFVSRFVSRVVCVNRKVVVHPTSKLNGQTIGDIYGSEMRLVRHDHAYEEVGCFNE